MGGKSFKLRIKRTKYRYFEFKTKSSKSHIGMIEEILYRIGVIFWQRLRRFSLFLNQNQDLYGWKKRPLEIVYEDLVNGSTEERVHYLESIINFDEISSFLELGSNSGPILFGLARKYPNVDFYGYDFNPAAVKLGAELAKNEDLTNLTFSEVDITDNSSLLSKKSKSWDVIFTWAVLIYVPPRSIRNLLEFCVSRANRLIFIEQHKNMNFSIAGRLIPKNPTWIRDYVKLLNSLNLTEVFIKTNPIPNHIWHPGGGMGNKLMSKLSKNE
jgi:hypothetical protein